MNTTTNGGKGRGTKAELADRIVRSVARMNRLQKRWLEACDRAEAGPDDGAEARILDRAAGDALTDLTGARIAVTSLVHRAFREPAPGIAPDPDRPWTPRTVVAGPFRLTSFANERDGRPDLLIERERSVKQMA